MRSKIDRWVQSLVEAHGHRRSASNEPLSGGVRTASHPKAEGGDKNCASQATPPPAQGVSHSNRKLPSIESKKNTPAIQISRTANVICVTCGYGFSVTLSHGEEQVACPACTGVFDPDIADIYCADNFGCPISSSEDGSARWAKMAEQGDAESQCLVGMEAELDGNLKGAEKWYRQAAAQGHAEAQYSLACVLDEQCGGCHPEAVEWYRKSAIGGVAGAQNALAYMYQHGESGWPQDFEMAVHWYFTAAEGGHTGAMMEVAKLFEDGAGVDQSDVDAAHWYAKAYKADLKYLDDGGKVESGFAMQARTALQRLRLDALIN